MHTEGEQRKKQKRRTVELIKDFCWENMPGTSASLFGLRLMPHFHKAQAIKPQVTSRGGSK